MQRTRKSAAARPSTPCAMQKRSACVSYLPQDAAAAARLKRDLIAAGVTVPVDTNALPEELRWKPAVKQVIADCGLFLICFSARNGVTGYPEVELALALDKQRTLGGRRWLIPLELTPCDLSAAEGLESIALHDDWDAGVAKVIALAPPTEKGAVPMSPQKPRRKLTVKGDVTTTRFYPGADEVEVGGSITSDEEIDNRS